MKTIDYHAFVIVVNPEINYIEDGEKPTIYITKDNLKNATYCTYVSTKIACLRLNGCKLTEENIESIAEYSESVKGALIATKLSL
jgi:hypothetical protein